MSDSTSFQFSHDKYLKKVSLDEFLSTIDSIVNILKNNDNNATVEKKVVTVEDNSTYNHRHITFIMPTDHFLYEEEVTHDYSFEELDEKLWSKCWELDCYIKSDNGNVRLNVDREEGPKRLIFDGNNLVPEVKDKIMKKYHGMGLAYKIGDGRSLISKYNYEFGCLITGMPYGRRGLF